MDIRELGSGGQRLDTVEINHNAVSFRSLRKHLRRLPGLRVTKVRSWPLTDDVWIWFEYKGYRFSIDSPFVDYWVHRESDECSDEAFQEVIKHLRGYQLPRFRRWLVSFSEKWRRRGRANNAAAADGRHHAPR